MKTTVKFAVKNNGDERTTNIDIDSVKKAIKFDPEFDNRIDIYTEAEERAIEKMYGKGKYFIEDYSDINGRGQVWQHSRCGGSDSVTGTVYLETDFFEIVK